MDTSVQQHLSVHSSNFCRADDAIVRKSQRQIRSNHAAENRYNEARLARTCQQISFKVLMYQTLNV